MRIVAFDPYVSASRAAQLGISLVESVRELCSESEFITVHAPKSTETRALIGDQEFEAMKPGARLVNASRGGIVDETALHAALKSGRVAGAALDVFESEPPGHHPLFELDSVVVTPHLGASTEEAQAKAGAAIAEQVLLALAGQPAPYAVNIQGGAEFVEALRPFISLTEKLGSLAAGLTESGISAIEFQYQGTLAEQDTRILTLAGLKGLFGQIVHEPVTYVNAPVIASERGIELRETKTAAAHDYVNLIVVRVETGGGALEVGGTLFGKKDEERIVRVLDYEVDMLPERYMCFLRYTDVPGIIGKVGTVLGEAGINIASMDVSRTNIGGEALMGLTTDTPVPPPVLERIADAIEARDVKSIDLGP